jgi:hypothetical protein
MTTTVLRTHVDVDINRPPEQVWAVVSDYAADTRWRKGIREMVPDVSGAPAVGTRVHEVLAVGGRAYTTDSVVTEAGPGMHYRFEGEGTTGVVRGGRTVVPGPVPTSSTFTYDVELEPRGVPRLVLPLMSWWLTRSLGRDLVRLRNLVEAS